MRLGASRGAGFLLTLVAVASCTDHPPGERTGAASSAITGGADTDLYPFAVSVCVQPSTNTNCNACSGTLIMPNLVMTARHCLFASPQKPNCTLDNFGAANGPENTIWVGTSPNAKQGTVGWHKSKKVFVPAGDTRVCGADIALVMLEAKIAPTEATPIDPVVQYPMTDHSRYSTDFTAIGYGLSANCASGSGRRRIREEVRVRCIPGDPLIPCDASVTAEEMIIGAGVCPGDSGSGEFEQSSFNLGTPVVFGISIRAADGRVGVATRTDAWRSLIVSAAIAAAADKAYPAPAWTVAIPPAPDAGVADSGTPATDGGGVDATVPIGPAPITMHGPGESCKASEECRESTCILDAAGVGTCTKTCVPASPACGAGELCVAVADTFVCRKGTEQTSTHEVGGGGCTAAPSGNDATTISLGLMLAGAILGAARRRRRG